jgi:hypothetical protein
MKLIYLNWLVIVALCISACQRPKDNSEHRHDTSAVTTQPDTIKKSIPKEEHAMIGSTHITIRYHAPAVRGRTIWGGLVPHDEVWVTGAHNATSIEVNNTIIVDGKEIPAGKYALFTIPGKEKWVIIVNKNWEQHLADEYNPADDVLRAEVLPEQLQNIQERLHYSIIRDGDSTASLTISWEKIRVSLPLHIKV